MEKIRWLFCIFKLAHITSTCLDADYSARLCPPQSIAPRVWNRMCGKGKGVGQMARDPFHKAAQFFFSYYFDRPACRDWPVKTPHSISWLLSMPRLWQPCWIKSVGRAHGAHNKSRPHPTRDADICGFYLSNSLLRRSPIHCTALSNLLYRFSA